MTNSSLKDSTNAYGLSIPQAINRGQHTIKLTSEQILQWHIPEMYPEILIRVFSAISCEIQQQIRGVDWGTYRARVCPSRRTKLGPFFWK